ncbi:MAG: hypothetical protein J6T55_04610 [Alphaproteobacteria bacterium]|nr:hypothetical protein [Alphaproteobacteria bacterium]
MQNKTVESEIFHTLDEVKAKGYISPKTNQISVYYQKISHLLNIFFKSPSASPDSSLSFMDKLAEIGRRNPAFSSLFPNEMMALYEKAQNGDTVTQNKAETKLLLFFSYVSPQSIEQKIKLLNQIQSMPDWLRRKKEVSKVIGQVANHYDLNQQFREDSDLKFLSHLSSILNQICTSIASQQRKISTRGVQSPEKELFCNCAALIKKHAPVLYNNLWAENFKSSHFRTPVNPIKDAAVVPSIVKKYCSGIPLCHDWGRY